MYHIHAEKDTVNKQHQKFKTLSVKFLTFAEQDFELHSTLLKNCNFKFKQTLICYNLH